MKDAQRHGDCVNHTTNYSNTFIEAAEDCPVQAGTEPAQKGERKTAARLQYEMLASHPYEYTSDDLLFSLHVYKNQIPEDGMAAERETFFSNGHACMRSSDLAKRYGWGIHFNQDSKMAIYAMESKEYAMWKSHPDILHKKALRTSKK